MQSVHTTWAGKTFALSKCGGDSPCKKPRNRRSKEERKTMVESFIKKYQNLNGGKFPSLSLTHKDVGGSFYTVREIVREIIQENRVLGPGYSTSKALNLEHCPQEHAGESLSRDSSASLSISTINCAFDQPQGENLSLYNQYRTTTQGMIGGDGSVDQKELESHPNVVIVSQVPAGERSENLSYESTNLGKLSGVTNENSGLCEETCTEVLDHSSDIPGKLECPLSPCDDLYVTPSISGSMVNFDNNGNKTNDMVRQINSSETNGSHMLSDRSSEASISLDSVLASISLCARDSPLAPSVKTCNAHHSHNRIDVAASLEVPKTLESDEVKVAFMPFVKDPIINMPATMETLSSIEVDEVSAAGPSRKLSLENDIDTSGYEKTETSFVAVDEISNGSFIAPVLQNLDPLTLEIASPLVHTLLRPDDAENVLTNIRSVPGELVQPSLKEKTFSDVEHHHEHAVSNTGSARSHGSVSKNKVRKDSEALEANPVWMAIKSLLNAVVKFWME